MDRGRPDCSRSAFPTPRRSRCCCRTKRGGCPLNEVAVWQRVVTGAGRTTMPANGTPLHYRRVRSRRVSSSRIQASSSSSIHATDRGPSLTGLGAMSVSHECIPGRAWYTGFDSSIAFSDQSHASLLLNRRRHARTDTALDRLKIPSARDVIISLAQRSLGLLPVLAGNRVRRCR